MLYSVIMAGGSGTRFWPASRRHFPKQLLPIGTKRPLVEETVDRISALVPPERVLIITNAAHARLTRDLLGELPGENVIGEPVGRDTAACIGLAALVVQKKDPGALMAVMPSDHIITPAGKFCATLAAAAELLDAHPEALITFGIEPASPATGYGYIKSGPALCTVKDTDFFEVAAFREKPDQNQAKAFLEEGGYYWNAGIFLWRAETILRCIARFLPELHEGLLEIEGKVDTPEFQSALEKVYPGLPKISIDYGVMEKAERRVVAAVDYTWDDVGSWRALERLVPPDAHGNHVQGPCTCLRAGRNIVSAQGGMVTLIGVEGLVVVHTPDATLVCRKEDAEAVKEAVEGLDEEYR